MDAAGIIAANSNVRGCRLPCVAAVVLLLASLFVPAHGFVLPVQEEVALELDGATGVSAITNACPELCQTCNAQNECTKCVPEAWKYNTMISNTVRTECKACNTDLPGCVDCDHVRDCNKCQKGLLRGQVGITHNQHAWRCKSCNQWITACNGQSCKDYGCPTCDENLEKCKRNEESVLNTSTNITTTPPNSETDLENKSESKNPSDRGENSSTKSTDGEHSVNDGTNNGTTPAQSGTDRANKLSSPSFLFPLLVIMAIGLWVMSRGS